MSTIERHTRSLPTLLGRLAGTLAPQVTTTLLAVDLPSASTAERKAATANVRDSIEAMPDLLRTGLGGAAMVLIAAKTVLGDRVTTANLPILAEFIRLTRGLGLAGVYEQRTPELLAAATSERT